MVLPKVLVILLAGLFNQTALASSGAVEHPLLEFASQSYLDGNLKLSSSQRSEVECLTKVVWYEARGESLAGKKMVANVVRNRMQYGKPFATTLCKVVYQPNQFAWTRDKKKKNSNFRTIARLHSGTEKQAVLDTVKVALDAVVLQSNYKTKATHFCSIGEKCNFKGVQKLGKVGNHTFFKYVHKVDS